MVKANCVLIISAPTTIKNGGRSSGWVRNDKGWQLGSKWVGEGPNGKKEGGEGWVWEKVGDGGLHINNTSVTQFTINDMLEYPRLLTNLSNCDINKIKSSPQSNSSDITINLSMT